MKKMSFIGRVFLGLLITAVVSGILAKAFINIAQREDPNFVEKAFTEINRKMAHEKDYSEVREEDISDVQTLSIGSVSADVIVEIYEGSTLKIEYAGRVPEKESDQLISLQKNHGEMNLDFLPGRGMSRGHFSLQWNDKVQGLTFDGDSHLEAKILLPKKFAQSLRVKTVSGDISVGPAKIQDLTLNTVSGDISIDHAIAENINITSVKGDIETNAVEGKSWALKSVSGDVKLYLMHPELMHMQLQTVSGDVSEGQDWGSAKNAKGDIRVKTVSGNITVHRYTEDGEDRD
jgi:hypothetical protein